MTFGVVKAMLHCWWTFGGQSKFLGALSNRMVLLWMCPGPSLLSEYVKHTSSFSCTSAADTIKGATLYLVDVVHVVYEAICAHLVVVPSLISSNLTCGHV